MQTAHYYTMNKDAVIHSLKSSVNGLEEHEANLRLKEYGLNEFPVSRKRKIIEIFATQFKSPFVLILVAASILAFFFGEHTDAMIIIAMVVMTGVLGFIQENKGEKSLQQLKKLVTFRTKVFRDGKETEVDSKQLVIGDKIFLEIGDIIPADARIITSNSFACNESSLTGETEPAEKTADPVTKVMPSIHEMKNMAFMGTNVASGNAVAIVIGTGYNTELGKTAAFLKEHETTSDFELNLAKFGKFLIYVIIALTIGLFLINTLLGKDILESLLFSIAVAVGITPEALPIIITIGLSHGAIALSKKKVIVKKLNAIEDLGNMDVLCSDKTGTLTENSLTLHDYFDTEGKKQNELLIYSMLCNSAVRTKKGIIGNSIDAAILELMTKEHEKEFNLYNKIGELEFDFERKRMSAIVEHKNHHEKKAILICKGSFDTIIDSCATVFLNGKEVPMKKEKELLREKFYALSEEGYRVIALAHKTIEKKSEYTINDEKNLCFYGFISFSDPPKKLSSEYIKELNELGVAVKIITGDSSTVTKQLCKAVGFELKEGKVIDGKDIEKMTEKEFLKTVEKYNVFARISPEIKMRIVKGIQTNGHVVGFLGDGINDADALKQANCGITVDSAVDIARESADIILTKKSLLVIIDGIKEGRRTFGNMIKYILNTISANFGNMFTLSISSLFLPFIPLLPLQILLTNFLSDGPMIMVSTDNVDKDYVKKPKKWSIKAISRFMIYFGIISSVFDLLTIAFILAVLNTQIDIFRTAWFLESVLSEIIITFSIRTKKPFFKSSPGKWLAITSIIVAIISIGLIYSPIAGYFSLLPLPLWFIGIIFAILIAYFSVVEIAKQYFYKKFDI
jgi:P-type Mg2+ transporter